MKSPPHAFSFVVGNVVLLGIAAYAVFYLHGSLLVRSALLISVALIGLASTVCFMPIDRGPKLGGKELAEALTTFFLHNEYCDAVPVRTPDDLRDWIFLNLGLICDKCGLVESFPEAYAQAGDGEDWAWNFAELAIKQARGEGWTVEYDDESHPVFRCSACQSQELVPEQSA